MNGDWCSSLQEYTVTIFENDLNTSNIAVDSNSNFQNICMIFIVQQLIYKNKIDLVYGGTHSANWILNQGVGETHSSKLKCIQYMGIGPGHGRTHSVNQELTQHMAKHTLLTKKFTNYMAEHTFPTRNRPRTWRNILCPTCNHPRTWQNTLCQPGIDATHGRTHSVD